MRRFTRYGQVYRDAPQSELEEFTKDKESPRSSADTSVSNVLLFPSRNGNESQHSGSCRSVGWSAVCVCVWSTRDTSNRTPMVGLFVLASPAFGRLLLCRWTGPT